MYDFNLIWIKSQKIKKPLGTAAILLENTLIGSLIMRRAAAINISFYPLAPVSSHHRFSANSGLFRFISALTTR